MKSRKRRNENENKISQWRKQSTRKISEEKITKAMAKKELS
jgi:hypothetical protein